VVLTLGAGDITMIGPEVLDALGGGVGDAGGDGGGDGAGEGAGAGPGGGALRAGAGARGAGT
jgi:hypothetical protein